MMTRLPLRARLAVGSASLAAVAIALFAVAVYLHMRAELFEEADLEISSYVENHARDPGGLIEGHFRIRALLIPSPPALPDAVSVFDVELVQTVLAAPIHDSRTWHQGETRWRGLWVPTSQGRLIVLYNLEELDEVLNELLVVCFAGVLVLIGLAAVSGWFWAGRALAPVLALQHAAESIHADSLHRRVPVPPARDELRRLAEVINAMLGRIETSFVQSRRFTADASHELRTPLTILRGELDRLLHQDALPPDHEARLLRMQENVGRLQRLTENLLLLARLDAHSPDSCPTNSIDFSALVAEAAEDGALLAEAHGTRLQLDLAPSLRLAGDTDNLRRAVLNLLDNATRYNRPSGSVWMRLVSKNNYAVLTVENTGPGISPELRSRLFQRFARGDAARSSGGHGLGLALTAEIARAHGGELRLADATAPDRTEFILTLPLSLA